TAHEGTSDRIGIGPEPDHAGLRIEDHVAHGPAPAFDFGDPEEGLTGGIESDKPVRVRSRFDEPDPVLIVDGHRIRSRGLASGRLPLLHVAGSRVEAAKVSLRIVHVPHGAVARDAESARACLRARELVFGDLHRFRIYRSEPVRPEEDDPRRAVLGHYDTVGTRTFLRNGPDFHVAGGRVQASDHVSTLYREPELTLMIEDQRVWIASAFRHREAGDLFRLRIDSPDVGGTVARIPERSFCVNDHVVRAVTLLEVNPVERSVLRIEGGDVV